MGIKIFGEKYELEKCHVMTSGGQGQSQEKIFGKILEDKSLFMHMRYKLGGKTGGVETMKEQEMEELWLNHETDIDWELPKGTMVKLTWKKVGGDVLVKNPLCGVTPLESCAHMLVEEGFVGGELVMFLGWYQINHKWGSGNVDDEGVWLTFPRRVGVWLKGERIWKGNIDKKLYEVEVLGRGGRVMEPLWEEEEKRGADVSRWSTLAVSTGSVGKKWNKEELEEIEKSIWKYMGK